MQFPFLRTRSRGRQRKLAKTKRKEMKMGPRKMNWNRPKPKLRPCWTQKYRALERSTCAPRFELPQQPPPTPNVRRGRRLIVIAHAEEVFAARVEEENASAVRNRRTCRRSLTF